MVVRGERHGVHPSTGVERGDFGGGRGVPEAHGLVAATAGEKAAVDGERDCCGRLGVAAEVGESAAGGVVPEAQAPVVSAGGELPAVRGIGEGPDSARVVDLVLGGTC